MLENQNVAGLAFVTMGLGWDPAPDGHLFFGTKPDIDLNAAALLFAGEAIVDVVYFDQMMSQDGAVRLLGDSTNGEGDGDDEEITVDLTRLIPQITSIFFIVTSYSGQPFGEIHNAFCRLVDGVANVEFARFNLSAAAGFTGFVLGKLVKTEQGWWYQPVNESIQAGHPVEAVPHLTHLLP
ncbi:TerD family protein [Nocardia sp. NPDC052566]|uniref:TerD family protein n=1 Tax=Nocardia sp. NPDC052566 TaxID=3364330 RepID=UPI0037C5AEA6